MTAPGVLTAEVIRAALAQMKPRPSVEMYPGDWLRDPISGCSLAANGFWWRATMVMHDAKPYGHMVGNNGLPLTDQQIAQRCGCRSVAELRKVLAEIDGAGIPGRTGDEDYAKSLRHDPLEIRGGSWTMDLSPLVIEQAGVIYSRRMIRDRILSLVRFLVSPKGQTLIPPLTHGLSGQNLDFVRDARARSAEEEDEVSIISPPTEDLDTPPRSLTPQQRAVQIIVESFPSNLSPHPGLAARWIGQMAEGFGDPDPIRAAEAVREIVWKYPEKGADYIAKCVGTAALKARTKETHGNSFDRTNRRTTPSQDSASARDRAKAIGNKFPVRTLADIRGDAK